jgi:hypothetical protein
MSIEVVDWSPRWAEQFAAVAAVLRSALDDVPSAVVEHVGSTSVPAAVAALESVGYVHRGDLGVARREAIHATGEPRRNV